MITLDDARRVISAAEQKAREIGQPMNIAVVDVGGNLVSHIRMDGAWLGSIDISINKAFTARAFDISTAELAQNSQPGQQFFGIHVSNHGRIMVFAGGVPLRRDGSIIGAIGVSGGNGNQDETVALAGAVGRCGLTSAVERLSGRGSVWTSFLVPEVPRVRGSPRQTSSHRSSQRQIRHLRLSVAQRRCAVMR